MNGPTARKRGRRGSPESWSVDAHVGQRVRMRRTLLGMSQEKLGEAIGLTFQQVQKYERGSNRISAGTLYRLGQVLDVPVNFFFDTYEDANAPRRAARTDESAPIAGQISRREARLLRLWRAAPPHVSDEMLSLLSSLSPNLRDGPDGLGEGPGGEDPDSQGPDGQDSDGQSPGHDQDGEDTDTGDSADGASVTAMGGVMDGAARQPARHSRTKPALDGAGGKPRRRHGAVWDPTDIVRASKPSPREG